MEPIPVAIGRKAEYTLDGSPVWLTHLWGTSGSEASDKVFSNYMFANDQQGVILVAAMLSTGRCL